MVEKKLHWELAFQLVRPSSHGKPAFKCLNARAEIMRKWKFIALLAINFLGKDYPNGIYRFTEFIAGKLIGSIKLDKNYTSQSELMEPKDLESCGILPEIHL